MKPPVPFYLGDKSHQRNQSSLSSPGNLSRPSTAGTPTSSIANPFSPPASIRSFNIDPMNSGTTSAASTGIAPNEPLEPIPRPRKASYYGSRPATGDGPSRTPSGTPLRETFAAPPSRPMTAFSTSPSLVPPKNKTRMRSTMLEDPSTLDKPWVKTKDPYSRIAYFLTYSVAFLGIAASAVRIYFGYKSVPLIKGNLCMVLDEDFNSDTDTTFGPNGNWFREVQLGGFGSVIYFILFEQDRNAYIDVLSETASLR